jgi:hypothetical protein
MRRDFHQEPGPSGFFSFVVLGAKRSALAVQTEEKERERGTRPIALHERLPHACPAP